MENAAIKKSNIAFWATCFGYFMTIVDVTVVNVALSNMQQQLHASVGDIQWVVVLYALTFSSILVSAGVLGEIYTNRKIYLAGLVVFTLSSLLCGIAPSLLILQISRALQGIGAGLMVPASLGIISELFPESKEKSRAMGKWGAVASIGAASGPILGGLLVHAFNWRGIFLINVPIGIAGFILALRYVPSGSYDSKKKLDFPGQLSSIIALGAFTYACLQAKSWGIFSVNMAITLGTGILAFFGFIAVEKRARHPMIDLKLFSNKSFTSGNIIGFLTNFGYYGQLFILSLYFEHIRKLSALFTGFALFPQLGSMIAATIVSGKMSARFGPRLPMVIGLGIGATGFIAEALVTHNFSYVYLTLILIVSGFGMALNMPAMTVSVMTGVPPNNAGTASGVLNAYRQAGSSLGIALIGSLVASPNFLSGFHIGVLVSGAAFAVGMLLAIFFVKRGK